MTLTGPGSGKIPQRSGLYLMLANPLCCYWLARGGCISNGSLSYAAQGLRSPPQAKQVLCLLRSGAPLKEETENASSRAAALASDFQGATLWITAKDFCRGLTAPGGGIRSASSIGTVVCSSAVVVGQRFERGVP